MQNLPYWGQLLIVAGVCAVMGFMFYQFIYTNELQEVTDIEARLESVNAEIRRFRPYEHRMGELEREIEEIRADLELIRSVFPEEIDDAALNRFVGSVANSDNIYLANYSAGEMIDQEQYLELVVNYNSRGRFQDFLNFFNDIGSRGQVMHIYGLNMERASSRQNTSGRHPVTASFTISTYIYKEIAAEPEESE